MITRNAFISFVGTLAKSSFLLVLAEVTSQLKWLHYAKNSQSLSDLDLFDRASRGPCGSIIFIGRKHFKAILASTASLIVIAALFADPVTQLVLSFPSRLQESSSDRASILATHRWITDASGDLAIPLALQAAITDAVYGSGPAFKLSCPTANCTWDAITTLGACGSCKDVTSEVKTSCVVRPIPQVGLGGVTYTVNSSICTTQFLDGNSIESTIGPPPGDIDDNVVTLFNSSASAPLNAIDAGVQLAQFDAGISAESTAGSSFNGSTFVPGPDFDIGTNSTFSQFFSCRLDLCARRYENISVRRGVTDIGSRSIIDLEESALRNGTGTLFHARTDSDAFRADVFSLDGPGIYGLPSYLYEFFSVGYAFQGTNTQVSPGAEPYKLAPNMAHIMFHRRNLAVMIDLVADAITEYIRTSTSNSTEVEGQALIYRTFIAIDLVWLVFPIGLACISLVLLIIVLLQTHSMQVDSWKSSNLPLLLYGFDGYDKTSYQIESITDGRRVARKLRGRVINDAQGHVFLQQKSMPTEQESESHGFMHSAHRQPNDVDGPGEEVGRSSDVSSLHGSVHEWRNENTDMHFSAGSGAGPIDLVQRQTTHVSRTRNIEAPVRPHERNSNSSVSS